jgi:hypothetical protein
VFTTLEVVEMKHKMLALIAGLGVSVALVTPASADRPLRGDQLMMANYNESCPGIAWYGTLEVDGVTFGMALYFTDTPAVFHGKSYHYVEGFKVFTGLFSETLGTDCEPGDVVLSGTDAGNSSLANAKFRSMGTVDEATGYFEGWDGRRIYQDGVVTEVDIEGVPVPVSFEGSLRLN